MRFLSRLGWLNDLPALKRAYHLAFRSPTGSSLVIPDLAEFCHATEPAPVELTDLYSVGRYEGRRDVWLRIREMLDLSDDELAALYQQRSSETRALTGQG